MENHVDQSREFKGQNGTISVRRHIRNTFQEFGPDGCCFRFRVSELKTCLTTILLCEDAGLAGTSDGK